MEKMMAAVVKQHGGAENLVVEEVDRPSLKTDEVLVEVEAFGLNFADALARKGLYREAPAPPMILGYDAVGKVIASQNPADAHWIGKRVAVFTRFEGYAQYIATPNVAIADVGENIPAHAATALATQYCTAYYASHVLTNIQPGENVLIHSAAGGVGSALIQLCKARGAKVFATASSQEKIDKVLAADADVAVNYKENDYATFFKKELGEARMDASFNAVAGSTFKKDLKLLGSGGRLVLYGAAERTNYAKGKLGLVQLLWKMGLVLPILLMAKSRSMLGVNMLKIADHKPKMIQRCMQDLVKMLEEGKIKMPEGSTHPIEALQEQHELLEKGKTMGKIAVEWVS